MEKMLRFLLIVSVASSVVAEQLYGRECITPHYQRGKCMPIYSCRNILDLVKRLPSRNFVSVSQADISFLKSSLCGIDDKDTRYVCCTAGQVQLNERGLSVLNKARCGVSDFMNRIAWGFQVYIYDFPWLALLKYDDDDQFQCGGTLISDRYVLTAAHCLRENLIGVRLGEYNTATERDCIRLGPFNICVNDPVQDIEIEEIITRDGFDVHKPLYDIALLRLKQKAEFKRRVQPICLPTTWHLRGKAYENYYIAGWGLTEWGKTHVPMWANVSFIEGSTCKAQFKKHTNILWDENICAGGNSWKESCNGDSGGPLAQFDIYKGKHRYIQFGVISFGVQSCGISHYGGLYTSISYHMQWITDNIRP